MDISKRIIIAFVTVTLIPILLVSSLSVMSILSTANYNTDKAAESLRNEELASLNRTVTDTSLFIGEKMQGYIDAVYMMEQYAENLFNNRTVASPQHSYFWDWEVEFAKTGRLVPGRHYEPRYDSDDISFEVSCYYMPRLYYRTPGDPFDWSPSTQYCIETSSNMDNIFRAIHASSSDYIWLYMGFDPGICDSHLFRNYPYDNLSYFLGDSPAEDYDPPTQEWYTNAAAINNDSVAFTSPYLDPSTGLVISMGRPVRFDNGTLIGVVSADVTLNMILDTVLNITILDSGYAFLLDRNGEVMAHPRFTEEGQTLVELEFSSTSSEEAVAFNSIISHAIESRRGQSQYMKGGQRWYLTYTTVANTGFILAVVVPVSEVVAPAVNVMNILTSQTTLMILILGCVLMAVAAVGSGIAYNRARSVVEPIKEMTRLVKKMSTQDFTRGISLPGAMYEEIGTTVDALLSFQEACKFGNVAFVRGDLRRALANYQNLLEISRRLNIDAGVQTMLLNIGNVYRQRGEANRAMEYYRQSLEVAEKMLQRAKENGTAENDALARGASVYHNMALAAMDLNDFNTATEYLEKAESIDRVLQNDRGLARRFDAMGLLMMRQKRFSEARSRFEEAKAIAKSIGADRTLAFIRYHEGELYDAQKQWKEAASAFEEAASLAESTEEAWLRFHALNRLADVLDRLNRPSHDIRRTAEQLRRTLQFKKSVVFVIDYSGSMQAEDRIRAAVNGAKEIVRTQINPQDDVSIIVFNESYTEILPLTRRGEYERESDSPIMRALDSLKYPNYATAFYDALGRALENLDKIPSSEHRWVIAITDGQDNRSKIYTLDALAGRDRKKDQKKSKVRTIEGLIRQTQLDVNLIVIGVGNELRQTVQAPFVPTSPKTGKKMNIEELLMTLCENVPQGQYISVVNSQNIKRDMAAAFQQVAIMMAQLEVGGTLTDY